jgi:hypothetical protein
MLLTMGDASTETVMSSLSYATMKSGREFSCGVFPGSSYRFIKLSLLSTYDECDHRRRDLSCNIVSAKILGYASDLPTCMMHLLSTNFKCSNIVSSGAVKHD